ncbi:MAG: ATP-binding cassette domain-containing protein, partial [Ignavibacteriales bacterium]|nr:ATP-binding cassette domain-containing protein [Ignavibacteriales bacterium]
MINAEVTLDRLAKRFGDRVIFRDLTASFRTGEIVGIAGPNGGGKSTLAKIIAGVLSPTRGAVVRNVGQDVVKDYGLPRFVGFAAPYLALYDEFTAVENLDFAMKARGLDPLPKRRDELLKRFDIYVRRNDAYGGYSSGMQQRVKLAFAALHRPSLAIFDEPTSNLDDAGKRAAYEFIREERDGRITVLAANDEDDLALCDRAIDVRDFQPTPKGTTPKGTTPKGTTPKGTTPK